MAAPPSTHPDTLLGHLRGLVPPSVRTAAGITFLSLESRDYRLFFQGNLVTQAGFWMQQVAFGWLILQLSNSAFYLGLAGFFRALPLLLLAPFGGVLADRFDRKRLIVLTQVGNGLIAVALSVLVFTNTVQIWHLMVSSVLSGAVLAINNPTRQALMPMLIKREHLGNAIALNSMSLSASRIVGPALAGVLIGAVGIGGCLFLQALGYIWSVANILMIHVDRDTSTRHDSSVLQNLVEGVRYARSDRVVSSMLLIAAVPTIFALPYSQLLPVFAQSVYDIGPEGLGLLLSSMGVGALVGALAVANLGSFAPRGPLLLASIVSFGALLAVFASVHWLPVALVSLGLVGVASSVYTTINGTIIQEVVPDHLRGRVMSLYMVTYGLLPLGTLPGGAIAQAWGAPIAVFGGGAICALFGIAMWLTQPELRQLPGKRLPSTHL